MAQLTRETFVITVYIVCNPICSSPGVPRLLLLSPLTPLNLLMLVNQHKQLMHLLMVPATRLQHLSKGRNRKRRIMTWTMGQERHHRRPGEERSETWVVQRKWAIDVSVLLQVCGPQSRGQDAAHITSQTHDRFQLLLGSVLQVDGGFWLARCYLTMISSNWV